MDGVGSINLPPVQDSSLAILCVEGFTYTVVPADVTCNISSIIEMC